MSTPPACSPTPCVFRHSWGLFPADCREWPYLWHVRFDWSYEDTGMGFFYEADSVIRETRSIDVIEIYLHRLDFPSRTWLLLGQWCNPSYRADCRRPGWRLFARY